MYRDISYNLLIGTCGYMREACCPLVFKYNCALKYAKEFTASVIKYDVLLCSVCIRKNYLGINDTAVVGQSYLDKG